MSQEPAAFDPYQPPQMDAAVAAPIDLRGGRRPGWLTALCVIALVLGGLGFLGAIMAVVTTVASPYMQQAMTPPPGTAMDEATRIQLEMSREQYVIAARYYWPSLGFAIIHFLVAGLLIASGVLALQGKPLGRKLLMLSCGFAILFELPRAWLTVVVMNETMEVMSKHMEQLMQSSAGGAAPPAGLMSMMMKGMIGVQLVVLGAWLLMKLGYYAAAINYLRRTDIRMHFEGEAPARAK